MGKPIFPNSINGPFGGGSKPPWGRNKIQQVEEDPQKLGGGGGGSGSPRGESGSLWGEHNSLEKKWTTWTKSSLHKIVSFAIIHIATSYWMPLNCNCRQVCFFFFLAADFMLVVGIN